MDLQKGDIETQEVYAIKSLMGTMNDIPAVEVLGLSEAVLKNNGEVEFVMPVKVEHTNTYGIIHGGILVTLLDTAMGYACHCANNNTPTVTLNITSSFIGNCTPGSVVTTVGRVIHAGRRTMVAEGTVHDETGKLLCTGQGTFFVKGENKAAVKTKN